MKPIIVNGEPRETEAATLKILLSDLGYADAIVATALNGKFVPSPERTTTAIRNGDRVEILAPMQGG